jgi:hypothetical protein
MIIVMNMPFPRECKQTAVRLNFFENIATD